MPAHPTLQNVRMYRALRRRGYSKEAAARISNAATKADYAANREKPMPATKMSRRHSAADEAALKACRGHLHDAMRALDEAGAPVWDGPRATKSLSLSDWIDRVYRAVGTQLNAAVPPPSAAPVSWWAVEVYTDAVVATNGAEHYRLGYTIDEAGAVLFAPRETWEAVEQTWEPVVDDAEMEAAPLDYIAAASVKAIDDARLQVRGICFGGADLLDDTFTKATDLGFGRSPVGMPVYYDHTLGGLKAQIGQVTAWQADDDGISFEVELDRRNRYVATVMALARKGALGASTGAASHLIVRQGGELKRWIVAELSLTPTPAEPRTAATPESTKSASQPEASPEAGTPATAGDVAAALVSAYTRPTSYRLERRYRSGT